MAGFAVSVNGRFSGVHRGRKAAKGFSDATAAIVGRVVGARNMPMPLRIISLVLLCTMALPLTARAQAQAHESSAGLLEDCGILLTMKAADAADPHKVGRAMQCFWFIDGMIAMNALYQDWSWSRTRQIVSILSDSSACRKTAFRPPK